MEKPVSLATQLHKVLENLVKKETKIPVAIKLRSDDYENSVSRCFEGMGVDYKIIRNTGNDEFYAALNGDQIYYVASLNGVSEVRMRRIHTIR